MEIAICFESTPFSADTAGKLLAILAGEKPNNNNILYE